MDNITLESIDRIQFKRTARLLAPGVAINSNQSVHTDFLELRENVSLFWCWTTLSIVLLAVVNRVATHEYVLGRYKVMIKYKYDGLCLNYQNPMAKSNWSNVGFETRVSLFYGHS